MLTRKRKNSQRFLNKSVLIPRDLSKILEATSPEFKQI